MWFLTHRVPSVMGGVRMLLDTLLGLAFRIFFPPVNIDLQNLMSAATSCVMSTSLKSSNFPLFSLCANSFFSCPSFMSYLSKSLGWHLFIVSSITVSSSSLNVEELLWANDFPIVVENFNLLMFAWPIWKIIKLLFLHHCWRHVMWPVEKDGMMIFPEYKK